MKKTVKAVKPYIYPGQLNFKLAPYEAWVAVGGKVASGYYPQDKLKVCCNKVCYDTLKAYF